MCVVTTEETGSPSKEEAAMHLLQLQRGAAFPIVRQQGRRPSLVGLGDDQRPVGHDKAVPVVEGQFDDALEPPVLPPFQPNVPSQQPLQQMIHESAQPMFSLKARQPLPASTYYPVNDTSHTVVPSSSQSLFHLLQPGLRGVTSPLSRPTTSIVKLAPRSPVVVSQRSQSSSLVAQQRGIYPQQANLAIAHQLKRELKEAPSKGGRNCTVSRETPKLSSSGTKRSITKRGLPKKKSGSPPPLSATKASPFLVIIKKHPSGILIPQSKVDPSARLPLQKPVPSDEEKKERPVVQPDAKDADVLLGRGGLSNQHAGNRFFRELTAHYRMAYCTAPKGDKGQLARNLCNYVRLSGGRFLTKADEDGRWYECGDERAIAKCAQAMREGAADLVRETLRKNLSDNVGKGRKRKKTKDQGEAVKKQRDS